MEKFLEEEKKQLNGDLVSDTYCDVCGCSIKNREKHLNTKKHQKEVKDIYKMLHIDLPKQLKLSEQK